MGRSEGQMVSARDESLRSGEVARLAGVNVETLRYYERRGLLPQPPRRPSGYRMYPPETVERVRFIKRAQQLGFSLREIQQLLQLDSAAWASCEEVCAITERKIQEIAEKIRDLQKIQRALQSLLRQCPRIAPISKCPILASLKNTKP
ncbi:MAG: Hg(II)-responsive transcriptional regulator [Gemmatales bacterium]|nr:Hg(II)-responsive transcriptional regulator [Gemmatales bacterium]